MRNALIAIAAFACTVPSGLRGQDLHIKQGVSFYGPDQNSNAIREYLTGTARAYVEGEGRNFVITDANRPAQSQNHAAYGAIDVRSNDLPVAQRQAEAQALSQKYGANGDVLIAVEEGFSTSSDNGGTMPLFVLPPSKVMTYYSGGKVIGYEVRSYGPTHTHIQARRTETSAQFVQNHGLTPTAGDSHTQDVLLGDGFSTGMAMAAKLPAGSLLNPLNEPQLRPIALDFANFYGVGAGAGFNNPNGLSGFGMLWSGSFPTMDWGLGGGGSINFSIGFGAGFGAGFGGGGEPF